MRSGRDCLPAALEFQEFFQNGLEKWTGERVEPLSPANNGMNFSFGCNNATSWKWMP